VLLYGRAGRLTTLFGDFRPGQRAWTASWSSTRRAPRSTERAPRSRTVRRRGTQIARGLAQIVGQVQASDRDSQTNTGPSHAIRGNPVKPVFYGPVLFGRHDAFGVCGSVLSKKIGVFQSSFPEILPLSPNAPVPMHIAEELTLLRAAAATQVEVTRLQQLGQQYFSRGQH
jgi:hypothetical protein